MFYFLFKLWINYFFTGIKTSLLSCIEIFSASPSLQVPLKSWIANSSKINFCTARLSGLAPNAGSRHFSTI